MGILSLISYIKVKVALENLLQLNTHKCKYNFSNRMYHTQCKNLRDIKHNKYVH